MTETATLLGHGILAALADEVRGLDGLTLADVEAVAIVRALHVHGGRRQATAAALGITRKTLWYRMRRHGIRAPRRRTPRP